QPKTINYVVQGASVDLGKIVLVALPGIAITQMRHTVASANEKEALEILLRNQAGKPLNITSLEVTPVRKKTTQCFDLVTPDITVDLEGEVDLRKEGQESQPITIKKGTKGSSGQATRTLRLGPCEQRNLLFQVPVYIGFNAGEQVYVHFALP